MSTIVGLDPSLTAAGIVVLVDGVPKVITHVGHTGRDGANWRQRSRRVRGQCVAIVNALAAKIDLASIDLVMIEGPEAFDKYGHAFDRGGLWHGLYGAFDRKGLCVPIAVVNPQTLKLWFTGNGAASKPDMTNAAMARYREPISTNDEADAIALCTAGAYHLGDPIPFQPNERQIEALTKVDWPEAVTV